MGYWVHKTHKTKNTNVYSQSANWPWGPTRELKLICSVTVWYIIDRKENQLGIWTTHHTHTHTRPKVDHLPTAFHWLRPAGEHQQRRELSAVKRLCYLLSSHHQRSSTTDTSVRHIVPVWMNTVRVWPGETRPLCLSARYKQTLQRQQGLHLMPQTSWWYSNDSK